MKFDRQKLTRVGRMYNAEAWKRTRKIYWAIKDNIRKDILKEYDILGVSSGYSPTTLKKAILVVSLRYALK